MDQADFQLRSIENQCFDPVRIINIGKFNNNPILNPLIIFVR